MGLFILRLGTHSNAQQLDICPKTITFATCAYKVKIVYLVGARNEVLCLPCLISQLTEQLSTNNTHALASSSLPAMYLKTLQMQSDDPNNGVLTIKLTYVFPCLSE